MKVTGMFPSIVCKNSEDLIKFASEKFGFKVAHTNQAIISENQSDYVYIMKNENDVRFDIIQLDIETPICAMCINVDNFDEALSVFKEDGYRQIGEPVCLNNAKKVLIKKSENIPLLLIQHIKKL